MAVNPSPIPVSVDYTSRDYYSLRDELIARVQDRIPAWTANDPADFGVALVEAFAYMGDTLSYYLDRVANESLLATASQRANVINIAKEYGYIPAGYAPATVTLTFTNTDTVSSVTIPAGTRVVGSTVKDDVTLLVPFETNTTISVPASSTQTVSATQGESVIYQTGNDSVYGEVVGVSDGSANQSFVLAQYPVIKESIKVYTKNGPDYELWQNIAHIIDATSVNAVYSVDDNGVNSASINFGDGMSGVIPLINAPIYVAYRVGGGTYGNVNPGVLTVIDSIPGLTSLQLATLKTKVSVTNVNASVGGTDPEDTENIRALAPALLTTSNRAITLFDFEKLAFVGATAGRAKAIAATPSSVVLYVAPYRSIQNTDQTPGMSGFGSMATATIEQTNLKNKVASYLTDKVLLGTTVTMGDPLYTQVGVSIGIKVLDGYIADTVLKTVKSTLLNYLAYNGQGFNSTLSKQMIEYQAQSISGVMYAVVSLMERTGTPNSSLNPLVGAANEVFITTEDVFGITTL